MEKLQSNTEQGFFSYKREGAVAIIRYNEKPLLHTVDLQEKAVFFDCLDHIANYEEIKVILFLGSSKKLSRDQYLLFYKKLTGLKIPAWGMDTKLVSRFYNAINQFVLKMATCRKILISSDKGPSALLYLCISLVCDYRIIADTTVYFNPHLELGLIPNGGGTFFLSEIIGRRKAFDLLMSGKDITAAGALKMGIVDEVVPAALLEEAALKIAGSYARKPASYLFGIKKMLAHDTQAIKKMLDDETNLLRNTIQSQNG